MEAKSINLALSKSPWNVKSGKFIKKDMPPKVGHKVRVCIGEEERDFRVTFGVVIGFTKSGKPVLEYQPLKDLKISQFDKNLNFDEVEFIGDYHVCQWKYY